ncbi:hypothetical protein ACT7DP_21845 [Bacillus paranthracis]
MMTCTQRQYISKQAQLLIKKLQEKPIMVAIGHVGPPVKLHHVL